LPLGNTENFRLFGRCTPPHPLPTFAALHTTHAYTGERMRDEHTDDRERIRKKEEEERKLAAGE
jgi:hypothetical protein